jgi:hypothetical protein
MTKQEKDFHTQNHQAMAAHSAEMAEAFSKSADLHGDLASASEMTDPKGSKTHAEISKCHGAMAKSCVAAGQAHLQACDKLASMPVNEGVQVGIDRGSSELKVISDKLDKLLGGGLPSVSAVPRFDAPRTLVPRAGQPTSIDRDDAQKALRDSLPEELRDVVFDPKQSRG